MGKHGKTLCYNREAAQTLKVEPATLDRSDLGRAMAEEPQMLKNMEEKKLNHHAHVYCMFSQDYIHEPVLHTEWIPLGFHRSKGGAEYIPITEVCTWE